MGQWTKLIVLIITFVPACWLGFQLIHEIGHILAAWFSGGIVQKVIFHPLTFSRTDVSPNPNPLLVVWSGPVIGVVLPLLAWLFICKLKLEGDFLARFFAGFCLIANGAYIGCGSFARVGDAGNLLIHGSPVVALWSFGILCCSLGLGLWHGLGKRFGIGNSPEKIPSWTPYFSVVLLLTLLLASALSSL